MKEEVVREEEVWGTYSGHVLRAPVQRLLVGATDGEPELFPPVHFRVAVALVLAAAVASAAVVVVVAAAGRFVVVAPFAAGAAVAVAPFAAGAAAAVVAKAVFAARALVAA